MRLGSELSPNENSDHGPVYYRAMAGQISVVTGGGCVQQALAEQQQLLEHNAQLQQRLADAYHQRLYEGTQRDEHAVTDYDMRYLNYMGLPAFLALLFCVTYWQ